MKPAGTRIRRFRCQRTGCTVSLLPCFLCSRVTGSLQDCEDVVRAIETGRSKRGVAQEARGSPVAANPSAAARWIDWRAAVAVALLTLARELYPQRCAETEPTLAAFGAALGTDRVLLRLRAVAARHLHALPAPLGLAGPSETGKKRASGARNANTQFPAMPRAPPDAAA